MLVILSIVLTIISKDVISKIFCIVFPIATFVACGFEHCVANMYLIPLGSFIKHVPVSELPAMFGNIIPVTIGNIIGGVFIITVHPIRIRQLTKLMRREY